MSVEATLRRQPVQQVVVDAEAAGQRIDNFLNARLKGVPRVRIYRGLRRGEVRVNRGRITAGYRLREGDVVRIPPLEQRTSRAQDRGAARPSRRVLERLEACILHEDSELIVLDKPAGMAVHGGSGLSYGAIEGLRALRPGCARLELVHRLDRETSGCLLIAKTRTLLAGLHEALRAGAVRKTYLLLVKGTWSGGPRHVDERLSKRQLRSGERVVRLDPDGQRAVTRFRALARAPLASLLEARLETGRTHQIRVHAASLGQPVAGDPKYGQREFNRVCRRLGLERMFLHASAIAFRDTRGVWREYHAPLPAELRGVLAGFGLAADLRSSISDHAPASAKMRPSRGA